MTDQEIITGCLAGDNTAVDELVKRFQPIVFRLCTSMLGTQDVEDLVQDVFIKVLRSLPALLAGSSLFAWFYRITVNQCHDELRKRKNRRWFSLHSLSAEKLQQVTREEESVSVRLEKEELQYHLQRALAGLAPKYRELIVLRDLEGLGYQEIAQITGLSSELVKSRLHQARNLLGKTMRPYIVEANNGSRE